MTMLLIQTLFFSIIQGYKSHQNLFNITLGILNARTIIACGSSIHTYSSFDSTKILSCPYVTIQEKNIRLIDMEITTEEVKMNLSSQWISPPIAMIKLSNNSLIYPSNFTQWNTYYFLFLPGLMCRYSFSTNTTNCFYYPPSINFTDVEEYVDQLTAVHLIFPNQTHRGYIISFIIIVILVLIICPFDLQRYSTQTSTRTSNSLLCMTNKDGTIASPKRCAFDMNIDQKFPDNNDLGNGLHNCALEEANTGAFGFVAEGSCYAEVSIDYPKKSMSVYLTHVPLALSKKSPYDDMFGFANGIESVVQYKINGNLESERLQMTTRVQCKTADNCAVEKLRPLLANITIADVRKDIFKVLKSLLNPPDLTPSVPLTCKNEQDEDVTCENDENRCKYDRSKDDEIEGCAQEDSNEEFDVEYRFNIVEKMEANGNAQSDRSFKCSYLCKSDLCNSDDNFIKAEHLLGSIAMGSKEKADSPAPKPNPAPAPAPAPHTVVRSNSVSRHISFYDRSMIIFFVLIQILSN